MVPLDWKTYTLGEIYTERKEAGDPELPILTVSIHSGVSDGALDEDEIGKTVKRIADKTQYKTARAGDLVFNMMRAWQGAIGVARSDGLVSPAYIVAAPNEEQVFPLFMDYYMKTPRIVGTINRQSYGVTDFRKRLYWDSFAPIKCTLPSIPEQQKIAEILTAQDKVIELQEKLVAELTKLKKAYLSKMFPRKGEKVPKLRFRGFTGDWEQRKLSDNAEFSKGRGYSKSDLRENGSPIILYGRMYTKYQTIIDEVDTFAEKANNSVLSQGNEVIVPASGETAEEISVASSIKMPGVILGGDLNIIRPNGDILPEFLALQITYGSQHSELSKRAKGKTVSHLHNDDFKDILVSVPFSGEQARICGFLSSLDNTIALHQHKLEQEKQKKKALMQLLLTGIVRV